MGVTVNKDGSLTITLDDDYNLPQSLLGNPIMSNEIDALMAAKDSKGKRPGIDDMSKSFSPIDLSDVDLGKFEKETLAEDIDKSLGLNQDIDTDITKFPLINKYLQSVLYGIDGEGGALGMKDSYDDLIKKTKREIQAEKNLVSGSPSSRENLPENRSKYRVAPVEIFERITGLDKDKKKDKKPNKKDNDPLEITVPVNLNDFAQGMEDNAKNQYKIKTPKRPEPESKMSKFLSGLMDKDEFLMDLGLSLMQGEGLFPGVVKAAKAQKAADQQEAATELANLLTDATIRDKLKGTTAARNAEEYALTFTKDKKSDLFAKKYQEYLEMDVNKDSDDGPDIGDLGNILLANAYLNKGEVDPAVIKKLLDSYFSETIGQGGGPEIEKEYITAS